MCETSSYEYYRMNIKRSFRNDLVRTIAFLLQDICEENNILNSRNDNLIEPFIGKNPRISIEDFLNKCLIYSNAESSTFIIMLIYIDRLCEINNFIVNSLNVYRIIFSSFVIAIKYNEEKDFNNEFFSKLAGMSLTEMNLLELIYLNLIDYKLYISDEDFLNYYENINDTINCMFCCN